MVGEYSREIETDISIKYILDSQIPVLLVPFGIKETATTVTPARTR